MPKKYVVSNKIATIILAAAAVFIILIVFAFQKLTLPQSVDSEDLPANASYEDNPVTFISSSNDVPEQDISKMLDGVSRPLKDNFNIKLSHNNFFYTDSIDVEITTDIPDAEIFYSLDGSIPEKDSAKSKKYTGAIHFEKENYNTPYVLKVKAYAGGDESHMTTHTYFVSEQVANRFTTLVFAISTDRDNLYGYENGILVEGKLRDDYIAENGRQDITPPDPANFNIRGKEGEREVYVEVFTQYGECVISQAAGLRVRGGWSRAANKKSLGLYADSGYNANFDKFNYEFFPGDRRKDEYQSFISSYSSLLLRNGGNDREGSLMREELSQTLAKQADFLDSKNAVPACVFLNGEYYGFFWLEQNFNEAYIIDYYGGDIKNLIEIGEWEEPATGDLTVEENFQAYSEIMDIDNYMKYYAFQIYTGNKDWPHNNKKYWRFDGKGAEFINKYYDGRFRMLLYDDEMAWGMYGAGFRERTINRILRDGSSRSFAAFMKRADMVEKFCNQMFDLMNTVFTYESVEKVFNSLSSVYEDELAFALKARVINTWMKMSDVRNEQRSILRFAEGRRDIVIADMAESLRLESDEIYYVSATGCENAKIILNTLAADGNAKLNSCYFTQHSAILKAIPDPGYAFDFWEVNGEKFYDYEVILSIKLAVNNNINAVLHVKDDEAYKSIVISTVRLDQDHDFIELHNPGASEYSVGNLFLSNDRNDLQKFKIENAVFPARTFLGYYGSNAEDKADSGYIFDFKIQKGDTIYLSDAYGNILQELAITKNIGKNEIIKRLNDGSYKIFKAE